MLPYLQSVGLLQGINFVVAVGIDVCDGEGFYGAIAQVGQLGYGLVLPRPVVAPDVVVVSGAKNNEVEIAIGVKIGREDLRTALTANADIFGYRPKGSIAIVRKQ